MVVGLSLFLMASWADAQVRTKPARGVPPSPATVRITPSVPGGGSSVFTVSPSTITFTSPSAGTANLMGTATLSIDIASKSKASPWSFTVRSTLATLGGPGACSTIPVSAIQVSCSAPVANGNVGAFDGTISCPAPVNLSTTPQTITSGIQSSKGGPADSYQVTLTFTFFDDWRYAATLGTPCTLNLTYDAMY